MSARTPSADGAANSEPINRRFAAVQQVGTRVALPTLVVVFLLYVGGLVQPLVPLARLPGLLHLDADALTRAEGMPTGWGWVAALAYGDVLSLGALMLLVAVIAVAYLSLVPLLLRLRERVYLLLVLVQLLVFALAAGGGWGGH